MHKILILLSFFYISIYASINERSTNLKSLSNLEILTKEELELLKCNRLSECLEFATGISSVNGEGDIFSTTAIHGNTQSYNTSTLLLVDGIPVSNPYNGSFNLDSIPLSSISRVEIIKGDASVVLNIITIDDKNKGMVRSRYGSYETFLASTSLSYDLGENLSMGLFAEHTKSSGETFTIHDENGETRDFAQEYKNNSLMLKLKYNELWFHAQLFERKLPNYNTSAFTVGAFDAKEENDESEYLVGIGYKQDINNDIFLKLQSSYHNWILLKNRLENNSTSDVDSDSFYNEIEAHFFTNSDNSNILGVSYELTNAHIYNDASTNNFSLYDNGNYHINDSFNFLYGGKYFYSSYKNKTLSKDINYNNFSARTGLIYKPTNNIAIKALYASAHRVPTYFEKEIDSDTLVGNMNLTPELSQSYDFLLTHELESFNYSLGFFYCLTEDKIARVDAGAGIQKYENIGNINYYGIELNTKFRFSKTLWGFANYSYLHPDTKNDDIITSFTYDNMLNLAISKLFAEQYLINASLKHLDSWGEAPSYNILNFSFDYKPKTMKNLSYEMVMKNILDAKVDLPEIARDNPNVTTIPSMYESRIYLGLKYDF